MPDALDEARVRHIARLARLNLTEEEIHRTTGALAEILAYFAQLDEVDTENVQPMAHAMPITDVVRDDEPGPSFDPDRALQNAPQREQHFFRVPKVLDQGSGA